MPDSLRPCNWSQYIGQANLKEELDVAITAAVSERRPLEPILFVGPPGAGKTSLAEIVAKRMGEPLYKLLMPVTLATLVRIVREFEGVLFLDELADAPKSFQHTLRPLLEFGFIQQANGSRVEAGDLSILAATTDPQQIIPSLYDRFTVPSFDAYSDDDMAMIVLGMAEKAGVEMDVDVALLFGAAACGVPRRARKFVVAYKSLGVTREHTPTVDEVMTLLRTHHDGLTKSHVDYLEALRAFGGTRGLKTLADHLRLHENIVGELERLLFDKQYIEFTEKGRCLTRQGYARLKGDEDKVAA